MTSQIANRLGQALQIRSGSRLKVIESSIKQYVRETPQSPTTPLTGTFDTSQVVTGQFDDARISDTSVTQHQLAMQVAISVGLDDYADDAAAAVGGVAVGEWYRTGSLIKTRVV